MWHRVVGTDPARTRLTNAVAVTVAVLLSVLAAWLIVRFRMHDSGLLSVSVLAALQVSTSIKEPTPRGRLLTTALSVIPLVAAPAIAISLDRWRYVEIALFILLAGAVTWARRISARMGELGMIAFLAYFFALFLRPPLDELGYFLLVFVCLWAAAVLVRLALLREHPVRQFAVLLDELRATSRLVITGAVGADPHTARASALTTGIGRVDDVARAIGGWQVHFSTEAILGLDAEDLANQVFDARIDVEHAALEIANLIRREGRLPARLTAPLDDLTTVLSRHPDPAATAAAAARADQLLADADDTDPVELTAILIARATLAHQRLRAVDLSHRRRVVTPAEKPSPPRPAPEHIGRLAVQAMLAAGLAALVGESIDASRWYWAVMAAFLIFVGSTTRTTVLHRAWHRVAGTLGAVAVGFVVGVALSGPSLWHIALALVSVFGALYFGPVRQWLGAFFSTLLLVAVYGLLGILHPHLLTVRVEETAAGAAVGVACAFLVFSISPRPALAAAINGYFDALAALLTQIEQTVTGTVDPPALLAATDHLDAAHARFTADIGMLYPAYTPGRWSRAGELRYLTGVGARAADHAAQAALHRMREPAAPALTVDQQASFHEAVAHVSAGAAAARTALLEHTRVDVDPEETTVLDLSEQLGGSPRSAITQTMLMLSRVNWAMLRLATLREQR